MEPEATPRGRPQRRGEDRGPRRRHTVTRKRNMFGVIDLGSCSSLGSFMPLVFSLRSRQHIAPLFPAELAAHLPEVRRIGALRALSVRRIAARSPMGEEGQHPAPTSCRLACRFINKTKQANMKRFLFNPKEGRVLFIKSLHSQSLPHGQTSSKNVCCVRVFRVGACHFSCHFCHFRPINSGLILVVHGLPPAVPASATAAVISLPLKATDAN